MIILKQLNKTFISSKQSLKAIDNLSLQIEQGEVFGIIGHSGAGKSTLIRCLNLLERPDSGEVMIDGVNLMSLNNRALMQMRRKIGMIFQHFNLLSSQTVFNNIAFPLRLEKMPEKKIQQRVTELLNLVGLSDQHNKYPAQLSGGQKQRVGIARALANSPQVLLCDEATSALDPKTTQSILELLAQINQRLSLTIVLITHEMDVIRKICHRVAVIDRGQIIEQGAVEKVFLHPQAALTRGFICDAAHQQELLRLIQQEKSLNKNNIYQITYIGQQTFQPHLSQICQQKGLIFSILSGNISYIRDLPYGQLIVCFEGEQQKMVEAIEELRQLSVDCLPIESTFLEMSL